MDDEAAFLEAIRANPGDEAQLLAYADWLEKRGDPRAEYLQLQRQLDHIPTRLRELRQQLDPAWVDLVIRRKFEERPDAIRSLSLWVGPEATSLSIHHGQDLPEDRAKELARQYTTQWPDFSVLDSGVLEVIRGLFPGMSQAVRLKWSRAFKSGRYGGCMLDFGIKPSALFLREHGRLIQGCQLAIFELELHIDLWAGDGNAADYNAVDLDEMGVEFEPMANGANYLARCFGFSDNTGFSYPIVRMDSEYRGYPYVHMDLH